MPVQGRVMDVSFMTEVMDYAPARAALDDKNCTVSGKTSDPNGAAAVEAWAGVPEDNPSPLLLRTFQFKDVGGKHVPITTKQAWDERGAFLLVIVDAGMKSASLQRQHIIPD